MKDIRDTIQDQELEYEILSRLIREPELIAHVYGYLSETDFYGKTNSLVLRTILAHHEKGETWNPLILKKEVEGMKISDYLTTETVTEREFISIIKKLKSVTVKRKIWEHSSKLTEKAIENPDNIIQDSLDFYGKLQLSTARKLPDINSIIEKHSVLMEQRYQGELTGISTGFKLLDNMVGNGFQKNDLILVGARPSVGKTSLSLTFAYNAAKAGFKVLFVSAEMRDQDIMDRLIAFDTGLSCTSIIRGKADKDKVKASYERLKKLPLSVVELYKATTNEVYAAASREAFTKGLDLCVVDYLQYLYDEDSSDNEAVRVGRISRNLKNMATMLNIAVLAPTQLNRKSEQRGGDQKGVPQLHDLRESGSLEQDADVVMMLNRDLLSSRPDDTNLRIAKNRKGETGSISLTFNRLTTKFDAII